MEKHRVVAFKVVVIGQQLFGVYRDHSCTRLWRSRKPLPCSGYYGPSTGPGGIVFTLLYSLGAAGRKISTQEFAGTDWDGATLSTTQKRNSCE